MGYKFWCIFMIKQKTDPWGCTAIREAGNGKFKGRIAKPWLWNENRI